MNFRIAVLTVFLATCLTGCAGLSFFNQENMKGEKVGLKCYYPKPYLLVARDGTTKVTSVSIIYLPDTEHPVYARARSGYGSANLSLGFANGIITSFGQQTDTKIPETLTSLGGFGTAIATATKTFREAKLLERQSSDFGKCAEIMRHIIEDLKLINQGILTSNDKKNINEIISALDELEKEFKAPGAIAQIDNLTKKLEKVSKNFSGLTPPPDNLLTEPVREVWGKITKLKNELAMILEELKPKAVELPAFSLYEIVMQGNKTIFKEVSLDTL